MKKAISLFALAAALLCSCNKDDDSADKTPQIKEMAVSINFSTLDQQVLDVVDITILGIDFQGNEINVPVTHAGEYRWKKSDPTFTDGQYLNPITLELQIEAKEEPKTSELYNGGIEYTVNCEAYEKGKDKPYCSNQISHSSLLGNEGQTDVEKYQNALVRIGFDESTYSFDYGLTANGTPNFGWQTKHPLR